MYLSGMAGGTVDLLCNLTPKVKGMKFNPLTMGGGAVRPFFPCFLPFTQNYLDAPIPENS